MGQGEAGAALNAIPAPDVTQSRPDTGAAKKRGSEMVTRNLALVFAAGLLATGTAACEGDGAGGSSGSSGSR